MQSFRKSYGLKLLIKELRCYQNPESSSCVDLTLANYPLSFQKFYVLETGLSDIHKMTVSLMKMTFTKLKPRLVHHRDYEVFSNDKFRHSPLLQLSVESIGINSYGQEKLCSFMNKLLKSAQMKRSRLRNRYFKNRSKFNKNVYNKRRNLF